VIPNPNNSTFRGLFPLETGFEIPCDDMPNMLSNTLHDKVFFEFRARPIVMVLGIPFSFDDGLM
jgi:hypothetical protein